MIEVICEYVARQGAQGHFELAFGPGGLWSALFSHRLGYRGATVLRDETENRRYLIVDIWDSEGQWREALAEIAAEGADPVAVLSPWIETSTEVGVFAVRAEATVRPGRRPRLSPRRRTR